MPVDIRLEQLDAGNGIEATLIENTAAWHKTCRNKISSLNLERALKRKNEASKGPSPIKTRRCSSDSSQKEHVNTCIFCDNVAGSAGLHKASTFELDFKVRKCATELNDSRLLTKLAGGDMVAIDAQYHTKCLAKLYKSAQQLKKDTPGSVRESSLYGIAFAELISHIETFRDSTEMSPVFSMTELRSLYSRRLEKLGIKSPQIHTTRLKNRILAAVPDLRAHSQGRDVLLAFDKDIGAALKQVCNQDFDSEALILAKAAKIVRRDIFGLKQTFIGRFPTGCQEASVTASLTALISMILDGPGIEDESTVEQCHSCATQTLSQLIVYNTVKSRRNKSTSTAAQRHNRDRETPVPIYLALKIHGETRKRGLVDAMHAMGLCISYDRMLTISTDIANQVCDVTDAFLMLANSPPNIPDNILSLLEKFVVLLYDRMSGLSSVNEARQHLFSRKSCALESIPPTQAALTQHTLRAAYQGGHVWGQVLTKDPQLPNPGEWGWERLDETSWKPKWTTLDQAQQKCYELIHCSCKKACRGLCKCNKASLKCTALCHCEGNCFQDI